MFEFKIKDPHGYYFTTDNTKDAISGNILTTIFDHLAKVKCDNYKRSFKNFKPQDFQKDLEILHGIGFLDNIDKKQTKQSFDRFFNVFETLLVKHAPLKKVIIRYFLQATPL